MGYMASEQGIFSFNEAGAINPGKLHAIMFSSLKRFRFNEAGAINPGKRSANAIKLASLGGLQ